MSFYDDVYLAEPEDFGLGDLGRAQLLKAINGMEAALDDPDKGGPPGWRKRTGQALREARQRLSWLGPDDDEDGDDNR